jgi:hypothetical protein
MSKKNGVTPEFRANFTRAWPDKDPDGLPDHMADGCTFMASAGDATEGTKWIGREALRPGLVRTGPPDWCRRQTG